MIQFIKKLLGLKKEAAPVAQAPYKVEPPVVVPTPAVQAKAPAPAVTEGKVRTNVKKTNPNAKKPSTPPATVPKAKAKAKPKAKK